MRVILFSFKCSDTKFRHDSRFCTRPTDWFETWKVLSACTHSAEISDERSQQESAHSSSWQGVPTVKWCRQLGIDWKFPQNSSICSRGR